MAADIAAKIVTAGAYNASARTRHQRIRVRTLRFERVRLEVTIRRSMKVVAAALGDNVDHSTQCFAILRFKTAGLDLHFLDEVEVYATAERAEIQRVGAKAAITGVSHIGAVDDVLVLQSGCAVDGRIRYSCAAAVGDAGSH